MTDQEKIAQLLRQAEELKQRMIKAGYTSPEDEPEEPTGPANPELDLETELDRVKATIRAFSKNIK